MLRRGKGFLAANGGVRFKGGRLLVESLVPAWAMGVVGLTKRRRLPRPFSLSWLLNGCTAITKVHSTPPLAFLQVASTIIRVQALYLITIHFKEITPTSLLTHGVAPSSGLEEARWSGVVADAICDLSECNVH